MPDKNKNILLSIGIITFNHGIFLPQLLNSIFTQKVNFEYEVVIVDDASTDNTGEILAGYRNEYPTKLKLIINESNKGVINNAIVLSENLKGKYICFLDGDDYWIYDKKLQEQIDFLELNIDYIGCFHDAKIISTDPVDTKSELYKQQYFKNKESYSSLNKYDYDFLPKHLVNRRIIPTASLIFRQINLTEFLKEYKDIKLSLNWAVHLFIIKGSKFRYFDNQWSVYNDHPGGVSKKYKYSDFINNNIKVLKRFRLFPEFKSIRSEFYKSLCREYKFLYHATKEEKFPVRAIFNYCRSYCRFCFYKLIAK